MSPAGLATTSAATISPSGIVIAALPMPLFIARSMPASFADRRSGAGTDAAFDDRR